MTAVLIVIAVLLTPIAACAVIALYIGFTGK